MRKIKKINKRLIAGISLNTFIVFALIGGACENDVDELKRAYYATAKKSISTTLEVK